MKRTALRTFLLLAATIALAPACLAQSDDFNDGNDAGWTRYNPIGVGTWSFPNGGYRLQTASSGNRANPGRAGSLRADVTYTNFYAYVDITNWNDNVGQSAGLLARVTDPGLGRTDGYAFTWDRGSSATSGDVDLSRITDEAPTGVQVVGSDSIHLVPGRTYRLVFIGIESTLEGRVYEHPDLTNPVVRVIGTDSTYTSGMCGLVIYDNSGTNITDVTFDNYFATKSEPIPPPPLFIDRTVVDGTVVLSWSTNLTEFVLQTAPSLLTPSSQWIDLVDPIFVNEQTGRYEYFEFTDGPQRFFRLRRPPD